MHKKPFAGIDYFRLIAAFMVIAIHISPLSAWNEDFDFLITYCIGRIAVPFFFMTTGYFVLAPYVLSHFKKKYISKYILKNIELYLAVSAFYFPISIYSGNAPKSVPEFAKQLIFDGTFYHLWYIPAAIVGCTLLAYLTGKSVTAAVYFSLIAYIIGILGDSYYGLIKNIPPLQSLYAGIFLISSYTRNGIFFAPIFILLGMLLAVPEFHCRKELCKYGFLLSIFFMLAEGWITYSLNLQKHNSMYLFLLPVMYFLFQLLLQVTWKTPVWLRDCSMILYIIHPAIIIAIRGFAKATNLTEILTDNTLTQYISVCILSLATAIFIESSVKRRYNNEQKR